MVGSERRIDESRDFFLAQDRGKVKRSFRIGVSARHIREYQAAEAEVITGHGSVSSAFFYTARRSGRSGAPRGPKRSGVQLNRGEKSSTMRM